MSSDAEIESTDDTSVLTKTYRSVSPRYQSRSNTEMDSIGWAIFLGMVILFVPLLPVLAVVWTLEKLVSALMRQRGA